YPELPGRLFAVKFSPDGARVVAGSSNDGKGEVRVFETDTAKPVSALQGIRGPIYAVAHHPTEKLIASAGVDGVGFLNTAGAGALGREFVPVPVTSATAGK